ncbi:group II intron reverse transcriptase/maturase [Nannocystis pusilla]|uniref:group II intron reverse transcriptase/maturase n=1 Tax=Nannocystis pusilla TaxID=889268 RepID=UPI003DA2318E
MSGTPKPNNISTKQDRIAKLAQQMPGTALRTLGHHIEGEWLREAHRRTRKDAAPGVDGVTAEAYERDLEGNLERLLGAAKTGQYRAPPVRRVEIPKGDGKSRPLGIPTHEDKVLQRAVAMVLEPIYESDFYDFSYGFRPGRTAHQALEALWRGLMNKRIGWVLDVDVQSFFDTLDHQLCRDLLSKRVSDGVIVRLVGKWLNAGVLEGGVVRRAAAGTPQGGVISPLLANIYLHEVLDRWWVEDVLPRMRGQAFLIRYADDFVICFEHEDDARNVQAVLPKRFEQYSLRLHPDKTRLLRFERPRGDDARRSGPGQSRSFDFLGFTHTWAKTRRGGWAVLRSTMRSRFTRAVRAITSWCRQHLHAPLAHQAKMLAAKLRGHDQYYGITGNFRALRSLRHWVQLAWWKSLRRRSQRGLSAARFSRLILARFPLPPPRVVHSVYRSANL